jgi:thiol-disulfide isomerase/thioredoxin
LAWPTPGRRGLLLAWSPDGKQIALGGFDNDPFGVWVLDVDARQAIRVLEGLYTMPAWSPDGTRLAFDHRSQGVREIWMIQIRHIQGQWLGAAKAAELSRALLDPRVSGPTPSANGPRGGLLVGKPAPLFTLQDLSGKQINLADLKGKVVLLDFWATWCPPCVEAIPHLEMLHQKYKEQGLVIIGLNDEADPAKVGQFVNGRMSYLVLPHAAKQFQEYGIRVIPTLFYIDKEGMVRHQESGFGKGKEKELEAKVRELLDFHTIPSPTN